MIIAPDGPGYERYRVAVPNDLAQRYQHHQMRECMTCGHVEWMSSNNNQDAGVSIYPFQAVPDDAPCPMCAEAFTRAPEVARWVVAVVVNMGRKLKADA